MHLQWEISHKTKGMERAETPSHGINHLSDLTPLLQQGWNPSIKHFKIQEGKVSLPLELAQAFQKKIPYKNSPKRKNRMERHV